MPKKIGKLKEAKTFSKEIVFIRGYFIEMKDEHGQSIYHFYKKKDADEFYKIILIAKK